MAARNSPVDSQRRLEGIVTSAMDAIITIDGQQRIILFNPAAERMFGCTADEALGSSISQFIPERYRAGHDKHIARFNNTGVTDRSMGALGAISGMRASGEEFPIEASISQVDVAGERLSTVILRDISERNVSEQARDLLAREVDHRAKNALSVAQALVSLTKAASVEEFAEAIRGRISALARAHSLLSQSRWQGASLHQLISEELAPYAKGDQLELAGPDVSCAADAVQSLSLVFHELATNAVKYGSLSQEGGRVRVTWETGPDLLVIRWSESGGPPISMPSRAGFGTKLLNQAAVRQLDSTIEFDWDPAGLRVRIALPPASFMLANAPDLVPHGRRAVKSAQVSNVPSTVLLVEDEELIAMELSSELTRLGWAVVGPAATLAEAKELLQTTFDAAVLDVNLRGRPVYPVAQTLMDRDIPFIFCTGYEMVDPEGRFPTTPVLRKPVSAATVSQALSDLLRRRLRANA